MKKNIFLLILISCTYSIGMEQKKQAKNPPINKTHIPWMLVKIGSKWVPNPNAGPKIRSCEQLQIGKQLRLKLLKAKLSNTTPAKKMEQEGDQHLTTLSTLDYPF